MIEIFSIELCGERGSGPWILKTRLITEDGPVKDSQDVFLSPVDAVRAALRHAGLTISVEEG